MGAENEEFKISPERDGNKLKVSLKGEINVDTSRDFDDFINNNLEGVEELEFDLKEVDFVSSAGLRVFLNAQKIMDKQGSLVIHNMSQDVFDAEDIREIVSRVKETAMNLAITKVLIHRGRKAVRDMDDNSKRAISMSEELLMRLLDENKDTEYGKLYDFAHISSIEEYKEKVPLSTYDDYEPYIKRMVEDDEKNLLTVRPPKHYALSSGSVGVPKHIPVSGEELDIYSKYGTSMCFGVIDEFYRNTTGRSLKPGFGVNLIELKFQDTKHGVPKGAISGNIMKQVKDITDYILTSPWDVINPQAEMDLKYLRARFALEREDVTFLDGAFMTALVDMVDSAEIFITAGSMRTLRYLMNSAGYLSSG